MINRYRICPIDFFRELVANIIAHREYLNPSPAFINIFSNKVEFINPNNPKVFGKIDPENFTPVAKNPIISKLMLQMGLVEEVGSGLRNINKYLPHYSKGSSFEFIDKDMFSTVIWLDKKTSGETSGETSQKIISMILTHKFITIPEMSNIIGITERSVERNIHNLQKNNQLKRIGSTKNGYWKIIEKK